MAKPVDDLLNSLSGLSRDEVDAILREDFGSFVQAMFAHVVAGPQLVWASYLDLVCAKLAQVCHGRAQKLIITLPPRHLKSFCVSVALPAFYLGHYPTRQVMCVSYGQDLAKSLAEDCRRLMETPAYEALFGRVLARRGQSSQLLKTLVGGVRRAISLEGAATGVGADLMIFDDPQKPGETLSEAIRRSTNRAFEETFLSRRNDPATSCMIIVMQRLHEDDFVAHAMERDQDWEILNLPAIAEQDEAYPYTTPFGEHFFLRPNGTALHPDRISKAELEKIRFSIGEAAWATQYQQRPAPLGGGIVKIAWLRRYTPEELPPKFDRIIQSWDTANQITETSAFSVCTTWGVLGRNYYLLGVLRQRFEYHDLRETALSHARAEKANVVLIENQASGIQLLQELKRGNTNVRAIRPEKDKQTRMSNQTGILAEGRVFIPDDAPWLQEYLYELSIFPASRYTDQVDSTSQALQWLDGYLPGEGLREVYREEAQAIERREGREEEIWVVQGPPEVNRFVDAEGRQHSLRADGYFHLATRHAVPLLGQIGWSRVQ